MPKISVIVPVYGAEKTLEKCVESLLYGQEKDLEILLIEDCSKDDSWSLCQRLAAEHPQVKCFQNEKNSGVSHTRNRGLDNATGQYILFVDSDDSVSAGYAHTLIRTFEQNPHALVVCGYTFIDHTVELRRIHGLPDASRLPLKDFFRLAEGVLLQQLWNKVFVRKIIEDARIRFDETISMGEDYQFVLDYLNAAKIRECVVIGTPLYYYVRWTTTSLMSHWGKLSDLEKTLDRVEQLRRLTGDNKAADAFALATRRQYVQKIKSDRSLTRAQRKEALRLVTVGQPAARHVNLRERLGNFRYNLNNFRKRVRRRLDLQSAKRRISVARKGLIRKDVSIISQNCIGGVFSHDMGLEFRSPTVNLFISAAEFMKFVMNLEYYLSLEPEFVSFEGYPVGKLGDIELHFVHFNSFRQARQTWIRRARRVDLSKIVVLSTDRDGFNGEIFEKWKALPYPKVLFTACRQYADHPDSVYYPEFRKNGCILNLIPQRKFYKGNKLLDTVNGEKS